MDRLETKFPVDQNKIFHLIKIFFILFYFNETKRNGEDKGVIGFIAMESGEDSKSYF